MMPLSTGRGKPMGWRDKPREEEREGAPRIGFDVLGTAGREAIHDATLDVLENVGVKVPVEEALDLLDAAGCLVDACAETVRFPRRIVEEALESTPGTILLASRDGGRDYLMGGRSVGYTNFGEGIRVYDLETGEHRDSTLDDLALIARLCDALEMVETFEMAVTPTDVAPESAYLEGFVAAIRNTTKHVHAGVETGGQIEHLVEIAAAVVGGTEALRERLLYRHLPHQPPRPVLTHPRDHDGVRAPRHRRQRDLHGHGRSYQPYRPLRHHGHAQCGSALGVDPRPTHCGGCPGHLREQHHDVRSAARHRTGGSARTGLDLRRRCRDERLLLPALLGGGRLGGQQAARRAGGPREDPHQSVTSVGRGQPDLRYGDARTGPDL